MQNTLNTAGMPLISNIKQTAVETLTDTDFIMVAPLYVLTSIMSRTFQFVWEIS